MSNQLPIQQRPWAIIGAPLEGTGEGRGEVRTPALLRAAGIRDRLRLSDQGDLEVPVTSRQRDPATGVTSYPDVLEASIRIRDAVSETLAAGRRPLVLGGCCSVLPGAFAGARAVLGRTGMLFVDGHLDLHTGGTTRTGNLAGMALAVPLGYGAPELVNLHAEPPMLRDTDLVAVGYDPADPDLDKATLGRMAPRSLGFPAPEVVRLGARRVARETIRRFRASGLPVWLHLDVDVLDSLSMPAVSYPGSSGIGWEMLEELLRPIAKEIPIAGIAIADFNADLDDYGDYARAVIGLLGDSTMITPHPNPEPRASQPVVKPRRWTARLHDLAADLLLLR
jgi:arginase